MIASTIFSVGYKKNKKTKKKKYDSVISTPTYTEISHQIYCLTIGSHIFFFESLSPGLVLVESSLSPGLVLVESSSSSPPGLVLVESSSGLVLVKNNLLNSYLYYVII